MNATVASDGKLAIPDELLRSGLFAEGTRFEVVRVGEAAFLLKKTGSDASSERGSMAEWLFSCPEKDWFVDPARSEMLDAGAKSLFDE